jgi:hypothetical protein
MKQSGKEEKVVKEGASSKVTRKKDATPKSKERGQTAKGFSAKGKAPPENKKGEKEQDKEDASSSSEEGEEENKDEQEQEEVFEELSQKKKAGKAGKLTQNQKKLSKVLVSMEEYVVGRIQVNPAQLKPPPEKFAARELYPNHLENLFLHFLTGGVFVAQKDFILFMEEVCNFPSTFSLSTCRFRRNF